MQFVRNTNHLGLAGLSSSQEKDISFSGDNTHQANQVVKGQKFSTFFEKEMKKSRPYPHPSARPRSPSPALFSPDQKNHKKITKQKTILEKLTPANLTKNLTKNFKIKDMPTHTHKQVVRSIVASAPAISMTSGKLKKTPTQTAEVGLDQILSPSRNTKHLKKIEEPFNQKIITRPENEVGFEQLKDLDSPRPEFITSPKSNIPKYHNSHLQQILANKKPAHIKQDHAIYEVLDLPKGKKKIQDSGGNRKENLIENIHKKGLKENKVSFQSLRKPFFIEKSEVTRPETGFEQNHFIPQAKESGPSLSNIKDVQVLDLSAISSSNKQAVINQISTYIEQSYIAGADHLDVAVYHDELGTFKVSAQKEGIGNQINLQIEVGTESARAFFTEQEFELIKSLDSAGIKLSDLKIITSGQSFISGDQEFSQQDILMSKEEQDFDQRSREESSQNDSDRRKNLWQKFKESRNRNFA